MAPFDMRRLHRLDPDAARPRPRAELLVGPAHARGVAIVDAKPSRDDVHQALGAAGEVIVTIE